MAKIQGEVIAQCPNPKCRKPIYSNHPYSWCAECGDPLPDNINARLPKLQKIKADAAALKNKQSLPVEPEISRIVLTTAPYLEGYRVTQTMEIVTAECIFGMNIFRDIIAGLTDVFGGRSETSQKVLHDARKTCLLELKREASAIGADAVIAVDLNYSEFSGGGKSMLFLVASGTAVKVEPEHKTSLDEPRV